MHAGTVRHLRGGRRQPVACRAVNIRGGRLRAACGARLVGVVRAARATDAVTTRAIAARIATVAGTGTTRIAATVRVAVGAAAIGTAAASAVRTHTGGTKARKTGGTLPVNQLLRDFLQEGRGRVELALTPHGAGFRAGQVQALHGAGQTHVRQAAFLAHFLLIGQGTLMREQAVLHAGQEHHGELQALGGVQGHEGDHALRLRLSGFGRNLCGRGVLTLRAGGAVRD